MKIIKNLIFIVYAVIAVFTTICLLSFNSYKVTELGNKALLIIDNDALENEGFKEGDLVIVDMSRKRDIKIGEKILFYTIENKQININCAEVILKQYVNESETTFGVEGKNMSSDKVIGKLENADTISGAGRILGILESRWGFLFIIILPALVAFIHEIINVFSEIRDSKNEKE